MTSTSRPYPDTGVVPLVPEELEKLVDGLDDEEGEDLPRVVVLAVQTAHHRARRAVLRHTVRRQLHDDVVNLTSSFLFTRCVIIWRRRRCLRHDWRNYSSVINCSLS